MSSKFEKRLCAIEEALAMLPGPCPCGHPEILIGCDSCVASLPRTTGQAAVDSLRAALDADERFSR